MMSNRIFPNWEQIRALRNPLTAGETELLRFLDTHLPADSNWNGKELADYNGWLIFAQPFLNGSRPDVVIFNPFVGLVIYEVKDWNLEHYEWMNNKLYVSDGKGSYPIKNPVKQVQHYKEKIIGQLVPQLGEVVDENKKNYGLIKTGLYFHNADTKTVNEFFKKHVKNYASFPCFGRDQLDKQYIYKIAPDVKYSKSKFWDTLWNNELMFWLLPPFHSIEQGTPLTLKGNQNKVAQSQQGHHRVRGVAGGGKTQALAYRAGSLAAQGYDVLVISFNITLWHYIKDMIARSPFPFDWSKITFTHFHGFCKDKLYEFEQDWPASPLEASFQSKQEYEMALEVFFSKTVPHAVREAINGKRYDKYDAILIDEGQDYQFEWYSLLNDCFLRERDELLVVSDKKQNIYMRKLDWLDKRVTRTGLDKFNAPYIDLTQSFRMPKRVAQIANQFAELFSLNQELKINKFDDMPVLFHSQHIVWVNIEKEAWLNYVYKAFCRLQKENYSPSDIVLLLPNHEYGMNAVNSFLEKNIEVNHVFEDKEEKSFHPHKKAFWMGDSRLKMSTIHSFKGWELLNIIIVIPEVISEKYTDADSVIYTAITRTRENLIVLNSSKRYQEFGETMPCTWDQQ